MLQVSQQLVYKVWEQIVDRQCLKEDEAASFTEAQAGMQTLTFMLNISINTDLQKLLKQLNPTSTKLTIIETTTIVTHYEKQ